MNEKLLEIFGTEELIKVFQEMDIEVKNVIILNAFTKSAKLIIDAAKVNLGGSYTGVQSSLGFKYNYATQEMAVGTQKRKRGQLAHIVESGTKERSYQTVKDGKVSGLHKTGRIKAKHFFQRALNTTQKETIETIYKEIRNGFNTIINEKNNVK